MLKYYCIIKLAYVYQVTPSLTWIGIFFFQIVFISFTLNCRLLCLLGCFIYNIECAINSCNTWKIKKGKTMNLKTLEKYWNTLESWQYLQGKMVEINLTPEDIQARNLKNQYTKHCPLLVLFFLVILKHVTEWDKMIGWCSSTERKGNDVNFRKVYMENITIWKA